MAKKRALPVLGRDGERGQQTLRNKMNPLISHSGNRTGGGGGAVPSKYSALNSLVPRTPDELISDTRDMRLTALSDSCTAPPALLLDLVCIFMKPRDRLISVYVKSLSNSLLSWGRPKQRFLP